MFEEIFSQNNRSYLTTFSNLKDLPLITYSLGWLTLFTLVSYKCLLNMFKGNDIFYKLNSTNERTIIILRGVPGIGKNNYILNKELNRNSIYSVVSSDDFFIKNNKYAFDRSLLNKAQSWTFEQFLVYLNMGVPRIYVSNLNNKIWNYSNYIRTAINSGYKVEIVELICNDYKELHYFNKRSVHNIPYTYSKKIFDDWDIDKNSTYVEPYLGTHTIELEGDSIPNYPILSEDELDKLLSDYMNKSEIVKKVDIVNKPEKVNNVDIVNKVDKDDVDEIMGRRLYVVNNNNKDLYYLKCGKLKGVEKIPKELIDYSIV